MSGRWASSNRRSQLPADWPKLRQQVKHRAGNRCEARAHVPDCDGLGAECDHVNGRDDHSLANLQWLSTPCHKAKTQADKPSHKRPAPQHPGVI